MASTTFSDGQSIIYSSWLNDVNTAVYTGVFPNGTLSLTNLSVSGSVSGSGFTTLVNNTLSAPGAIGSATPNTGAFTTLTLTNKLAVAQGGTGLATLTANNVILGNGTSTPSFVAPGTSGNVLTSNGTTWQSSTPAPAIGVGQSYTDYVAAGGRTTGTVYQNTTGKPIMVNIAGNGTTGIAYCDSSSSPTTQCAYAPCGGSAIFASMSFIVPNNYYYKVTGGLSYYCWSELR
jgi:hypothetical protein